MYGLVADNAISSANEIYTKEKLGNMFVTFGRLSGLYQSLSQSV